jgi:hypothetical protein
MAFSNFESLPRFAVSANEPNSTRNAACCALPVQIEASLNRAHLLSIQRDEYIIKLHARLQKSEEHLAIQNEIKK